MKIIRMMIMVLSLSAMYQFASAQNCQGNKVRMSKGTKGACGCNNCQSKCVDQSEVQAYTNMGWYLGECINVGRFCCNWVRKSQEQSVQETMLTDIHPDAGYNTFKISFNLSTPKEVSIKVYDINGKYVTTVTNKVFNEKDSEVTWDASSVNTGIYLLKMEAGSYCVTRKISVLN